MREGGGATLFSPPIERKKVSLKLSGREENNDTRRRLSGGYLSYMGGKAIANLTADRLKGGSSIHNSKHVRENGRSEQLVVEKSRDYLESDSHKRKGTEESVLPQWGHRKRSRCSRLEQSKAPISESASAVGKAEERLVGGFSQVNGAAKVRGQATLRQGVPAARAPVSASSKRNGYQGIADDAVLFSNSTVFSPADRARQISVGGGDDERGAVPASSLKADQGVLLACSKPKILHASSEATLLALNFNGGAGAPAAAVPPSSADAGASAFFSPVQALSCAANRRVDLDINDFEWPRILISLSRKEKEDDFLILKGTKPPQRPKKRPKVVEKALHFCMPGNWLSDVTRGRYDVREKKSVKKKPRGLKAMESMDSDSE